MAVSHKKESINATLTINDHPVRFQLDSAADVNTICQKHVRQHQVSPTTVRLNMWKKTDLKPFGGTVLRVVNPCTSLESEVKFVVVPNGFTNLLGLITIHEECFISSLLNSVIWEKTLAGLMKTPNRKYCHVEKFALQLKIL